MRQPNGVHQNGRGMHRLECIMALAAGAGIAWLLMFIVQLRLNPLPGPDEAVQPRFASGQLAALAGQSGRLQTAATGASPPGVVPGVGGTPPDGVGNVVPGYNGLSLGSLGGVFPGYGVAGGHWGNDAVVAANVAAQRAEATAAAALRAVQEGFSSMDKRLTAVTQGYAVPAPSSDSVLAAQVVTLSQQVASLTALTAQNQHWPLGAQPAAPQAQAPVAVPAWATPAPAPAPPSEEVSKKLKDLESVVERLSKLTDDRVSNVYSALHDLATGDASIGSNVSSVADEQGHVCRTPPCSRDMESCKVNDNCCSDRMYEMLVDVTDFLTRNNITYFLVEGTLLGAIRDKDVIPYTADVDLVVNKSDWKRAMNISKEWRNGKSYWMLQDPDNSNCARICTVWKGLPANRAGFNRHFDWDTTKVASEVPYYMDVYAEEMSFISNLMPMLGYPLSNVTIRNKNFTGPRDGQLWVESQYGAGWKTPDHRSNAGVDKYPSEAEAKLYAGSVLGLRKARTNAKLAHRMLEQATVEQKTGRIVFQAGVDGIPQRPGDSAAPEAVRLEGFKRREPRQPGDNATVDRGTLFISPPEKPSDEGAVTHFVAYWAYEALNNWDFERRRIGEPLVKAQRCAQNSDPFQSCSHGTVVNVSLPFNAPIPKEATLIGVYSANEDGEASTAAFTPLDGDRAVSAHKGFSMMTQLGILKGLDSSRSKVATCVKASTHITQEGMEEVISVMVRKTVKDMTAAIRMFGEWVKPLEESLVDCKEPSVIPAWRELNVSIGRLLSDEVTYEPGKALAVGGTTIFYSVNVFISFLRNKKIPEFGKAVGEALVGLSKEASPNATAAPLPAGMGVPAEAPIDSTPAPGPGGMEVPANVEPLPSLQPPPADGTAHALPFLRKHVKS